MTYKELLDAARPRMGAVCKACPVCDGRACGNRIPGPGAKGAGDTAIRNYQAWQAVRLNMDALHEGFEPDPSLELFGRRFRIPVFAGPVGAVNNHYGDAYNDITYNDTLVSACAAAGIAAFTGDGVSEITMGAATKAIAAAGGVGVPTVKPWDAATVAAKMQLVRECGAFAAAMDVDAAGLPFLKNRQPPAGCKSVEELRGIIANAGVPFIVKGVMTPAGAQKAIDAGAAAILVSNHGGRVLDGCRATAEVLPAIVKAVDGRVPVLVDGGIRSGTDVFRALALGAAGVIICRPFVTAVFGGGAEGVQCYVDKLAGELADAMLLTGAKTLADITPDMVWVP